jgi:hypothetical protein
MPLGFSQIDLNSFTLSLSEAEEDEGEAGVLLDCLGDVWLLPGVLECEGVGEVDVGEILVVVDVVACMSVFMDREELLGDMLGEGEGEGEARGPFALPWWGW